MANFVVTNPDTGTTFDTGVDINKINAIPNLSEVANNTYRIPGLGTDALMRQMVSSTVNNALSDPVTFEKNTLKNYTKNLASAQNFRGVPGEKPPDTQQLINAAKASINYLASNKVPASDINSSINSAIKEYQEFQQMAYDKIVEMNKPDGSGGTGLNVGNVTAITAAYLLPGVGKELAAALNVSTSVGTALASTAYQMSQGVDFDTALKNATVNAITQSGSAEVAKDISSAVGKVGADAIASAGGSIVSTLAKGGSVDDAMKNAGAALVASGVSSETGDRAIGAAAGGAITGGATGAALGAAGELGKPTPTDKGTQVASAGDITKDPGVVSDSPTSDFGEVVMTAPRDNVQVVSPAPAPTTTPVAPTPAPSRDQQIIELIRSPETGSFGEIVTTAPKEVDVPAPKTPDDVQVVSPDVTPPKDKAPLIDAPKAAETSKEEEAPEDKPTKKEDPNLFIYSSKSPLSQALKLGMGTGVSSSAGTTPGSEALGQALKTDAGDPLFGGKKKGKKSGWNVESLRYMGQES
jgi:hypothetical protein